MDVVRSTARLAEFVRGIGVNKLVVTNAFGPVNRGDEELLSALLRPVAWDEWEVTLIARDPALCEAAFNRLRAHDQLGKVTSFGPIAPMLRVLLSILILAGVWVRPLWRFCPRSQRSALDALESADLVVACPGGYFEDSSLSGYLAMLQTLVARLLGKRVIFAPQSIGPIHSQVGRFILRFILSKAEAVYVRDEASEELCKSIRVQTIKSVDLALGSLGGRPDESRSHDPEAELEVPYAVLVPMRWAFPRDRRGKRDAVSAYIDSMCELAEGLEATLQCSVVLMEQVGGDAQVVGSVAKRGGWKTVVPASPEGARRLMAGAVACVSSRLHGGVFAIQTGTPVAFLEYLPKTTGVLAFAGIDAPVFPIDSFHPNEVVSKVVTEMGESAPAPCALGVGDAFASMWRTEVGATHA